MPPRKPRPGTTRIHQAQDCSPQELAPWVSAGFTHVTETADISTDMKIVALRQGRVLHAGVVTDIAAALNVVWLLDEQSNTRKLIERDQFTLLAYPPEITRRTTGKKST
ncbi:hypothetical protein ACX80L_16050 [Arthrobacter sp. MDT1-48-3]